MISFEYEQTYFIGSKLITTTAMTKQLASAGHVTQSKQLTNSCKQLVPVPASSSNSTSSAGGGMGGRLCSPESTTSPPLIQSDTETVHGKNLNFFFKLELLVVLMRIIENHIFSASQYAQF